MPVDLEMFLSATRPNLYSYSHFVDDRFSLTSSYDDRDYRSSIPKNNFCLQSNTRRFIQDRSVFPSYDEPKSKGRNVELPDGTRKKKVSFADDKGLNLVQVREIPGSQKWTDLTLLTSASTQVQKVWKPAFQHPPWRDEALRLDKNKVALESMFVKKSTDDMLDGTVKVKNLAYEKNVFVRITFDRWLSHSDVKASFAKPRVRSSSRPNSYDTFSFSVKIAPAALRLVAGSNEASAPVRQYHDDNLSDSRITLSLTENIENISEIDAWSNFICKQPYW